MDAISLLTPHVKFATRPTSRDPDTIVAAIRNAYQIAWYGRPGPTFVDLPTELIMESVIPAPKSRMGVERRAVVIPPPPKPAGDPNLITSAARLLKNASAPLVLVGKGAAYARAEDPIRNLISSHHLPFLPTPMGKGIIPDSHALNTSSARSVALKNTDVILLLGARLNWILHYGEAPKYRPDVKIIQVDISQDELGRTNTLGETSLGIFGDIGIVVDQLDRELGTGWKAFPEPTIHSPSPSSSNPSRSSPYLSALSTTSRTNSLHTTHLSTTPTPASGHLTYHRAYHILKTQLDILSPPSNGEILYISEGANTMDISRSMFPLEVPRQRLDAGTGGTMGVGLGYAIAAWLAWNLPNTSGSWMREEMGWWIEGVGDGSGLRRKKNGGRKKIIALEGDSAFGFSGMEVETMARHNMDIVVVVMNNSGIYKGDASTATDWREMQNLTVGNKTGLSSPTKQPTNSSTKQGQQQKKGLRSTSLLYETHYEKMAEMVGGRGWFIRTEEELADAIKEAFLEREKVCVLNVIIDPGLDAKARFGWMEMKEKHGGEGSNGGSKL